MKRHFVELYHDESGERFQQLFRTAEANRQASMHGLKVVIFWGAVVFVCCALVMAKLWTMGAIVGLR